MLKSDSIVVKLQCSSVILQPMEFSDWNPEKKKEKIKRKRSRDDPPPILRLPVRPEIWRCFFSALQFDQFWTIFMPY